MKNVHSPSKNLDKFLSKEILRTPSLRDILSGIKNKENETVGKYLFTNSPIFHADRVISFLNLENIFEGKINKKFCFFFSLSQK